MSELKSKQVNVILALISVISFLSLDFMSLGSKSLTGADLLEMSDEVSWYLLYVVIPILQIVIRLWVVSKKNHAILCSCLMFIPIVVAFVKTYDGYANFDIGFYVYLIISISMVVVAYQIEDEEQTNVIDTVSVNTEAEDVLAQQEREVREE